MKSLGFSAAVAMIGAGGAILMASCSGEVTVFDSAPSKLCENGVFDESGEPIETGDECVDECLSAIAIARELGLALAEGASVECDTLAEDFDVSRPWANDENVLDLAAEACAASLEIVRETRREIDCDTSDSEVCAFETVCRSPDGATDDQVRDAALLEARLPGLFSACCFHVDAVAAYEDALAACQECPVTRRVNVCLGAAFSVASVLGSPIRDLGNTCTILDSFK